MAQAQNKKIRISRTPTGGGGIWGGGRIPIDRVGGSRIGDIGIIEGNLGKTIFDGMDFRGEFILGGTTTTTPTSGGTTTTGRTVRGRNSDLDDLVNFDPRAVQGENDEEESDDDTTPEQIIGPGGPGPFGFLGNLQEFMSIEDNLY